MTAAIVDTGPLAVFFDRAEQHHQWVAERIETLEAPLLVCEPVLAEAMYLLGRYPKAQDAMLELIQNGALSVAFRVDEHVGALRKLLGKYQDAPMSPSLLNTGLEPAGWKAPQLAAAVSLPHHPPAFCGCPSRFRP